MLEEYARSYDAESWDARQLEVTLKKKIILKK